MDNTCHKDEIKKKNMLNYKEAQKNARTSPKLTWNIVEQIVGQK